MSYQVPRQPELPVMNWVLPDSPSLEGGHVEQNSITKWKWNTWD